MKIHFSIFFILLFIFGNAQTQPQDNYVKDNFTKQEFYIPMRGNRRDKAGCGGGQRGIPSLRPWSSAPLCFEYYVYYICSDKED